MAAGTLPGVIIGTVIRVCTVPGLQVFRLAVAALATFYLIQAHS
jgi:hypothetical protein